MARMTTGAPLKSKVVLMVTAPAEVLNAARPATPITTPSVATTMAMAAATVGSSCSATMPNRPTCSTSVLEKVTPTMKLRCFIASSSNAVAASWLTAPPASQAR